jgi:group I intron endonuclease
LTISSHYDKLLIKGAIKMQGIYKIECKAENKVYIGSSTNINRRWREHKAELNNERHRNWQLQLDWDCYGDEVFNFEMLEETDKLYEREHYWITQYPNNYNIAKHTWNPMRQQELVDKMMQTKWDKNIAGKTKLTFAQKLTQTDVLTIIDRINNEESDIAIAKDYKVDRSAIYCIKVGHTWKHLHYLVKPLKSYDEKRAESRKKGLTLYSQGVSVKEIALRLNRTTATVRKWLSKVD